MIEEKNGQPIRVVDLTIQLESAKQGKMFVGQTRTLYFDNIHSAWGGIRNPINSKVNVFMELFTITNVSSVSFHSEILLNAYVPKEATVSTALSTTNQTIQPLPIPKAIIEHADFLSEPVTGGVNIFGRIIEPNSTFVTDAINGTIILGPGKSFSMSLETQNTERVISKIVYVWWEEEIKEV